jgi:hypothetical protein
VSPPDYAESFPHRDRTSVDAHRPKPSGYILGGLHWPTYVRESITIQSLADAVLALATVHLRGSLFMLLRPSLARALQLHKRGPRGGGSKIVGHPERHVAWAE